MSKETQELSEDRRAEGAAKLRLKSIMPSITVDDLEASLPWYRDLVGFHVEETYEDEGRMVAATLVAGVTRLMLAQDDGAKGTDRQKGQGMRLYLTTSQEVDKVAEAIKARGGALASEPADMPWGARAFNLVDPDGFQLTITS